MLDRYKDLAPRTPQDRFQYAILEQLVEINDKLNKLTLSELPIEDKSENTIVIEKKTRKKTTKK